MASPSTVLTRGYGTWGTVSELPTLGYGSGAVVVFDAFGWDLPPTVPRPRSPMPAGDSYFAPDASPPAGWKTQSVTGLSAGNVGVTGRPPNP